MTPTPLQQTLCNGLPYGLKLEENSLDRTALLSSVCYNQLRKDSGLFVVEVDIGKGVIIRWFNSEFKPILRPLSDLDKEITHNGERFVPYVLLMDEERKRQGYVDIEFKEMLVSLSRYPGLDSVEFWIIKRLLSWHFNIEQLPPDQFIPVTETFNPYK